MIDQRQEFVALARQPDSNISELCRRYGISRKTGYKWLARSDTEDRSRRPLSTPRRTADEVECRVLQLRDRHPAWGGRKIAHVLKRDQGVEIAPSTVTSVLRRHGRISERASEAAKRWQRFEHEVPNAMWQMDFKGHFATLTQRCHPLTVLDDHSRFNIVLQALPCEQRSPVQAVLHRAFERFGLPARINADNGAPWGASGQDTLTHLAVWLIRLGIRLSYSRPRHPQTNGKDERFHRTLSDEVLAGPCFKDLVDAQKGFSRWRYIYNHERPHESLGMQTPADRYRSSPRTMPGSLPPVEYLPGDLVRKVQSEGWFSVQGREIKVSKALAGQPVACRPTPQDGQFDVFFCHQKIHQFSLAEPC